MGMMVGRNQPQRVRIELHNLDGSYAGSISYTKSTARRGSSSVHRKKRLNYNFKAISAQLMMAKNSAVASQVAGRARRQVVDLLRRQALCRSGVNSASDYDEDELESAIAHAKSLARIAKKRVRHLRQEEAFKESGNRSTDEMAEAFEDLPDEGTDPEELMGLSEEEIRRLMEELERAMREMESEAAPQDELSEEMTTEVLAQDLEPADLEQLKRKHRNQELREIMEADMKYLRALFDKLAREQKSGSGSSLGGSSDSGQGNPSSQYSSLGGVTLELSGMEVPVTPADLPVTAEGANMDVTV